MGFLFAPMIVVFSLSVSGLSIEQNVNGTRGTYWRGICENSLAKAIINRPWDDLVSSDGYDLTAEGDRVLVCVLGGGALLTISPEAWTAANSIADRVGCPRVPHPVCRFWIGWNIGGRWI